MVVSFEMITDVNELNEVALTVYHIKPMNLPTLQEKIKEIGKDLAELSICGDYLDELIIPDGVWFVQCARLGLKKLVVPDSVRWLYCNDNFLEELEVPNTIEYLVAHDNILHTLRFRGGNPTKLGILELYHNRFTRFDFEIPECCESVMINHNYPIEFMSESIRNAINMSDDPYIP